MHDGDNPDDFSGDPLHRAAAPVWSMPICWSSPGSRTRDRRRCRASTRPLAAMWRERSSRRNSSRGRTTSSRQASPTRHGGSAARRGRCREAAGFGTDIGAEAGGRPPGLWARQRRIARAAFLMRADATGGASTAQMAQAIAEGLTLAEFDGGSHKTREHDVCAPPAWTVVAAGGEEPASQAAEAVAGDGCSASAATSRASWPTNRATR